MERIFTFDQLPQQVANLTKEVGELKRLFLKTSEQISTTSSEQLLTVQEAAKFLNLTVPTIYSKVSKGELPVMKRSKRLYFSREELTNYVKQGRRKTNTEIADEADEYLVKKGRKKS
jgi:excisionase family DNA binding protein